MRFVILLLALIATGCGGGVIQPATTPPTYGRISAGGGA